MDRLFQSVAHRFSKLNSEERWQVSALFWLSVAFVVHYLFFCIPQPFFIEDSGINQLGFEVLFVNGHTEKQMLPKISYQGKTLVFMADLLPTTGHIPLPYVMGYDTRPLLTIKEKEQFLNLAADKEYILFLEHDAQTELCTVQRTEKGVRLKETFKFTELFN